MLPKLTTPCRWFMLWICSVALLFAVGPQLGLQSWTCRNLSFEQVVDFAARHGIKNVQFFPGHLDPAAPTEVNSRKQALLAQHGISAYTFGVMKPGTDKEANRRLFEFARHMGMSLIIVEPPDAAAWDNLEALVKEYDIRLAIHNHGTGTVYGDPATVKQVLATRDHRIGVCLDVGWVTAAGFDAAIVFREYGDRVFDIHFKDKKLVTDAAGQTTPVDTLIGEGATDYADLFAAIKESGWNGVMAIETDSKEFAADPTELVEGAKAFFVKHTAEPDSGY